MHYDYDAIVTKLYQKSMKKKIIIKNINSNDDNG